MPGSGQSKHMNYTCKYGCVLLSFLLLSKILYLGKREIFKYGLRLPFDIL